MRFRTSLLAFAILLTGCQSAQRANYVTPQRGGAPLERLKFWHELSDAPVAGNDDAFHALLLFLDGADPAADYAARVATLKQRNLLPGDFNAPPGAPARRGTLAYAIAGALKLKGGVTMRLLGNSPRYALKELEFRGLMPSSSPNQTLSGNELVGLISKARDYQETGSADASAVAALPFGHTRPVGPVAEEPAPPWMEGVEPQALSLTEPIYAMMMQDPATTAPATAAAVADGPFTAVVESVKGDVQWKPKDDAEWRLLKVGDVLSQDATVETGAAARVVLRMPQGQLLAIYQLTEITLLEVRQQGGQVKTDIGMKHGKAEYEIFGAGVRYDAKVRTPNNTLAVRSTRVLLYEQAPFTPEAVSLVGRAEFFRKARADSVALGGRAGKVKVRADKNSAADTALEQAVVDPTFASARTVSEQALIANLISRGATLTFDPIANIAVLSGGSPFKTTQQIARSLPGELTFVATWDQPKGVTRPANIDLLVTNTSGDVLFPTGAFSLSKNGGRVPFDHRGGPQGGIEYAFFTAASPQDLFYVTALPASGSPSTPVTLRAFLNGLPLQIDRQLPTLGQRSFEVTGSVGPAKDDVVSGFVLPEEIFTDDTFDPNAPVAQRGIKKGKVKAPAAKPVAAPAPAAVKAVNAKR